MRGVGGSFFNSEACGDRLMGKFSPAEQNEPSVFLNAHE
jgi:hypothetical protein